ncbi:MAG: hypothetical protein K6A36_06585 [Paludibacteraceae bacterium]|nr:hypothetical protein [Paludibacteraceae bacterium]
MTLFACAILLTSVVGFTGCKQQQSQDEPQTKTPEVSTDIAISLPNQVGGPRRMPSTTVQTNGQTDFATNGMTNLVLVPFKASAAVTSSSTRYGANLELGDLSGDVALASNANGRAKVFSDKQVPQGTSAFLFYGESGAANTNLFSSGKLAGTLTGEPAAFSFKLQPICSNTGNVDTDAALFIAYLNLVASATDENGVAWKDYTAALNQGYYEMFQSYKGLNTLTTFGVERMMNDLYHSLDVNTDSLSRAIRKAITNSTYASLNGSNKVELVTGMKNFPQKYNIPTGAVSVAFATGAFGSNAAHDFGGLTIASLDRYVYPASLWYFANTKIKTSSASKASAYTSAASWAAILGQYENDNASVSTSTRSIALKDTIQYAVARLDVCVKTANSLTLNDNNPVENMRAVNIPASGYPLKAVLVGNQKNVGFDFTPGSLSSSDADFGKVYTIYDTIMSAAIAAQPSASTYSSVNSTLVLETAADDGAQGSDVYVALEFVNSGSDFYGIDQQLIPAGARFYMVGKLAASAATETGSKVFKQDFTTTARFSISNLAKAYSTIPDLKAPQLEIGMSVDLSWQAGHTYDISLE